MRARDCVAAVSIIAAFLLFGVTPANAQETCGPAVAACRNALFVTQDISAADDACALAVATDPADGCARIFRAATRILRVIGGNADGSDPTTFTDSVKEMLDRLGAAPTGRDIYSLAPSLPRNANGEVSLPADSPDGTDAQEVFDLLFVSAIKESVADLRTVAPDTVIDLLVPELVTVLEAVGSTNANPSEIELDFGESKLFESALLLWQSQLQLLIALDLDVDVDSYTPIQTGLLIQQDILDANPDLLVLLPAASSLLGEANQANRGGIAAYLTASNFIRNEVDDQTDDLISIEPPDLANEAEVRTQLAALKRSFDGPTRVLDFESDFINEEGALNSVASLLGPDLRDYGAILDLGLFYDVSPFGLRQMLPTFDNDNSVVNATLPDRTFGGVLVAAGTPAPLSPAGVFDDFERGRISLLATPPETFSSDGDQNNLNPTGTLAFDRSVFVFHSSGQPLTFAGIELELSPGDDAAVFASSSDNAVFFFVEYDFDDPVDLDAIGSGLIIDVDSLSQSSGTATLRFSLVSDDFFGFSSGSIPLSGSGTEIIPFNTILGSADLTRIDRILLELTAAPFGGLTNDFSVSLDDFRIDPTMPVPEPHSALPFGVGLAGWLASRRSRRSVGARWGTRFSRR